MTNFTLGCSAKRQTKNSFNVSSLHLCLAAIKKNGLFSHRPASVKYGF